MKRGEEKERERKGNKSLRVKWSDSCGCGGWSVVTRVGSNEKDKKEEEKIKLYERRLFSVFRIT